MTDLIDPFALKDLLWPDVYFYDAQVRIIESYVANDETFVVAGNKLGKDFVSGFICLHCVLASVLAHQTCRVVTTSVKDDHLRVLWGEIGRFVQTARHPLAYPHGPLVVNHRDVRLVVGGRQCQVSYLRGMVSKLGEGMAGHHAERTLLVMDECSGIDDEVYDQGRTWAKRVLGIGNPNPCSNFFFKAVKGGDILAK